MAARHDPVAAIKAFTLRPRPVARFMSSAERNCLYSTCGQSKPYPRSCVKRRRLSYAYYDLCSRHLLPAGCPSVARAGRLWIGNLEPGPVQRSNPKVEPAAIEAKTGVLTGGYTADRTAGVLIGPRSRSAVDNTYGKLLCSAQWRSLPIDVQWAGGAGATNGAQSWSSIRPYAIAPGDRMIGQN